jgi:anti-anti-sigma regulatory factor
MLKIVVGMQNGTGTLGAEGQVVGPWVEELRRSSEQLLIAGTRLVIDLNGVSFVDRDGVQLLRSLKSRGVTVVNCSPFVTAQLKG